MTRLEELVEELVTYLPSSTANQGLREGGPTGPGTLKGFKAKVAEVFRLGESVGWDRHVLVTEARVCRHCDRPAVDCARERA